MSEVEYDYKDGLAEQAFLIIKEARDEYWDDRNRGYDIPKDRLSDRSTYYYVSEALHYHIEYLRHVTCEGAKNYHVNQTTADKVADTLSIWFAQLQTFGRYKLVLGKYLFKHTQEIIEQATKDGKAIDTIDQYMTANRYYFYAYDTETKEFAGYKSKITDDQVQNHLYSLYAKMGKAIGDSTMEHTEASYD